MLTKPKIHVNILVRSVQRDIHREPDGDQTPAGG